MKKLPKITMIPVPEAQRRHTREWFACWTLESRLRNVDAEAGTVVAETARLFKIPKNLLRPFAKEKKPAVGQVRLLSPKLADDRPVYVALFREWEKGMALTAPFSDFPVPATIGELATECEEQPLKVLCVWNTRSIPLDVLNESWYVGDLSAKTMSTAWDLFRHVTAGRALPPSVGELTGAPIVMPDDPRIRYQDKEAEVLATVSAKAAAWVEESLKGMNEIREKVGQAVKRVTRKIKTEVDGWIVLNWASSETAYALAASKGKIPVDCRAFLVCTMARKKLFLSVELHSDRKHCGFRVYDAAMNLSTALDGSKIKTATASSVPIKNGQAKINYGDIKDGFLICSKSGKPVKLKAAQIPK